jgi:hypothetical protein
VLAGEGDGTFGDRVVFGAGVLPWSVAIGDLNSDGRLDLTTANRGANSVSVLLNLGESDPTHVFPLPAKTSELRLSVSPNPASSAAIVGFVMASVGRASLEIFDVSGRCVTTFGPALYEAGLQELIWDGNDDSGTVVPSGVYLVRLTANQGQATTRLGRIGR